MTDTLNKKQTDAQHFLVDLAKAKDKFEMFELLYNKHKELKGNPSETTYSNQDVKVRLEAVKAKCNILSNLNVTHEGYYYLTADAYTKAGHGNAESFNKEFGIFKEKQDKIRQVTAQNNHVANRLPPSAFER